MIVDEHMTHGVPAGHRRTVRIDQTTPIVPRAIAEGVCEEVGVWLQQPLPRSWVRELVGHANTVYAHNERFRRRINGRGDGGRDYLWMFMRHWLAALLKARRPQWFGRLPACYAAGGDLPRPPSARRPRVRQGKYSGSLN